MIGPKQRAPMETDSQNGEANDAHHRSLYLITQAVLSHFEKFHLPVKAGPAHLKNLDPQLDALRRFYIRIDHFEEWVNSAQRMEVDAKHKKTDSRRKKCK